MRSEQIYRMGSSRQISKRDRQNSYSPRLSTSVSEKCLWARSYKNEPVPAEIRRRLLLNGPKYRFQDQSDEQEDDIMPVEEVDESDALDKQTLKLPIFKPVGDWDQFSERRNRTRSERYIRPRTKRHHSVESFKLPQVTEDVKEDVDLHRFELTKLSTVKDQNEFNLKNTRLSSRSYTDVASKVESVEFCAVPSGILPELIPEMDAEETKSVKLPNQKSIITAELEKLIVDELDQKKRKREEVIDREIESIIEEKNEDEINTETLRQSLEKFDTQYEYLKLHADQMPMQNRMSDNNGETIEEVQNDEEMDPQQNTITEQADG